MKDKNKDALPLTSGLGVLRRGKYQIYSHADEKMMERFKEIADPSVTLSERGDQTATRCYRGNSTVVNGSGKGREHLSCM